MSSEFRIDRPGVYRDRYGRQVWLWCNPGRANLPGNWISIGPRCGVTYQSSGRIHDGMQTSGDIVAYVSPLPADILQRMAEALAEAEEPSQ
jgi:hypothetical protein